MTNYKHYLRNRIDKMRSSASELLLSRYEENQPVIELEPALYESLKTSAEEQDTTVQGLVNYIIEQHLAHRQTGSARQVTAEQKENNPLLLLDGLCGK